MLAVTGVVRDKEVKRKECLRQIDAAAAAAANVAVTVAKR